MVYDELGGQHLQDGLALLKTKQGKAVTSAEELHREWRRAKARGADAQAIGRMGVSGSVVVSSSLSEVLQPSDPSVPLWRRCKPELSSVAMQEEMHLSLDRKNKISISNQALTKGGLGGSTLRLGFVRALSTKSSLQLATSLSHEPYAVDMSASRRLSLHSTGSISLNLAARGIGGLTFQITRQLTRRLLGDMSLTLPLLSFAGLPSPDESGLRLHVHRSPGKRPGSEENDDDDEEEVEEAGGADNNHVHAEEEHVPGRAEAPVQRRQASPQQGEGEDGEGSGSRTPATSGGSRGIDGGSAGGNGRGGAVAVRHPSRAVRLWRGIRARLTALLIRLESLAAALTPAAGWRLVDSMKRRLGHTDGDVTLSPSGLRYGTALQWRHSERSRSKLSFRLGVGELSLTLSTERALSLTSASAVGIALQFSQRGLMTKLRIERHGHRLVLPIYLAASPSLRELLAASAVPAAIGTLSKRLVVAPIRARRRLKASREETRRQLEAEAAEAEARRAAAAEARLLEQEAAKSAREEAARGGLVILAAAYGDIDAFLAHAEAARSGRPRGGASASASASATAASDGRGGEGGGGEGGGGEGGGGEGGEGGEGGAILGEDGWWVDALGSCWLDVRIALQYAVTPTENGSMLTMPPTSKAAFRGFSQPPSSTALATAAAAAADGIDADAGASSSGSRDPTSPQPPAQTTTTTASGPAAGSGRSCRLWVRYRVGDEIRTANVADDEAVQLGPA